VAAREIETYEEDIEALTDLPRVTRVAMGGVSSVSDG
jgi:hypothetical protein